AFAQLDNEFSLTLHLGSTDDLARGACNLRPFAGHGEPDPSPDERRDVFREVSLELRHRVLLATEHQAGGWPFLELGGHGASHVPVVLTSEFLVAAFEAPDLDVGVHLTLDGV